MGKILIVDDDPNVQRLLQYTLKQEGYDVLIAADGAEGFRLWGTETPDLILLDVMLPKLDGYQVAAKIRAEEGTTAHVPIIMLTAEREVEQKVRGLRAGADDYLIKPFHPAELLARIKSLLARFAPKDVLLARPPLGRVLAFYGAKGGVGTTTIAINTAIALHRELGRKVCLVDGNLQFGDHRVFLDLGLDRKSIVDIVTAPSMDQDLVRQILVKHDSGVDLLLAPPSPETAELVTPEHLPIILEHLRAMYDYVIVDIDKRMDDVNLGIIEAADTVFVVMTADLSCLKNVRLVLETIGHLGYDVEEGRAGAQSLERVHRHQRPERRGRPQAHDRPPDPERVPRCDQRAELGRAVHVHEGRFGAGRIAAPVRPDRRQAGHARDPGRHGPLRPARRRAGRSPICRPARIDAPAPARERPLRARPADAGRGAAHTRVATAATFVEAARQAVANAPTNASPRPSCPTASPGRRDPADRRHPRPSSAAPLVAERDHDAGTGGAREGGDLLVGGVARAPASRRTRPRSG